MNSRNQSLDILRGIAVLLVIGRHYPYYYLWGKMGWIGVDLFFVLSGFLISGLLFADYDKRGCIDLRRFWIRRAFKIWPPLYIFLAVMAFLFSFGIHFPKASFLESALFVRNYFPLGPNSYAIGHTWSLGVEEHFYVLLPLLLLILSKRNSRAPFASLPWIFATIAAISLMLRIVLHPTESYASHFRFDGLFAGVALRYAHHFRKDWFHRIARYGLLGCAFCAPALFLEWLNPWMQTVGLTSLLVGFTFLLAWFVDRPPAIYLRPLAKVGFFSYSIYLWHLPIVVMFRLLLPNTWINFWLALTCSIVAGIIMAKLIERPALALRDRLYPLSHDRHRTRTEEDAGTIVDSLRSIQDLVRVEV